jgi:HlyD family secretion protein
MVQERKQLSWRWAWIGAVIILVLVFMSVRSLTRERLQVRAVQVTHKSLKAPSAPMGA